MPKPLKILVVDDEETLCELLRFNLETEGYEVDVAYSAEEALMLDISAYSLILLDIMMGDISGVQLASIVRNNVKTAQIPIIFCTARDSEADMIGGLDLGADDYITKPFNYKEVIARVRSQLRRYMKLGGVYSVGDEVKLGRLCYNFAEHSLTADGIPVKLTSTETKIIELLIRHPGRIFSADEIYANVWGELFICNGENTVMVHIRRIREKIEINPSEPEYLKVVWGIGYKFEKR